MLTKNGALFNINDNFLETRDALKELTMEITVLCYIFHKIRLLCAR